MFSLFDALEVIWDTICCIKDILFEKGKVRYKILGIIVVLLSMGILLYSIKNLYEFRGY